MPEVKINIPKEIHGKLKEKAKKEMRSLTNYLSYHIGDLLNLDESNNVINLSTLPEGTTIKTKTQKPLTPEEINEQRIKTFQRLARQILGQELDLYEQASLTPDNTYYQFAEQDGERFTRWAYTMPIEKQKEYIEEWKRYL